MTPLQTLEIRAGDIRGRLSEVAEMELTDELRSELTSLRREYQDNESKQTALKIAGAAPEKPKETDTETREEKERNELRSSVHFGTYVAAAIGGHPVFNGPEAEYNKEIGLEGNQFPLELLGRSLETRAEKANGEADTNQGTWLDRVFAESAAMRLGISMRSVAPGVAAYPVTTAGPSALQRGRGEAITESPTFAFSVTEIKPARRAIHAIYSIEDNARLPGLAMAMERDIRAAMVESVDKTIFNGDAGANENGADITGLRTAGITETTLTQANKIKGPETLAVYAAFLDGQYAAMPSDLNLVASVGTNVLYMTTVINSAASNETLGEFVRRAGMSWGVREGIDVATASGDFGVYVGLNRGIDGAGIAAVWEAGELIRDPYSDAAKGNVQLTLNYLWQMAFPRTSNFKRLKYAT